MAISPGIPDGFHGRKFGSQKILFSQNGIKRQVRELHDGLEIKSNFTTWFDRMCEYGFEAEKDFFPKMEESAGGRPATDFEISVDMAKQICMRDWRLELNSQSGFQGCVSTVFSIKWTILEVIVKNDKNSKGGRQQQIYMIYFGSDEMTSVLTPPEVQNNGGVQIRELQDYIVSVDTAKHICLISRTEKGKQWSDH